MAPTCCAVEWHGSESTASDSVLCGAAALRVLLFFFFSSRRRHTRFDCDWSSDVCSSDLLVLIVSWLFVRYTPFAVDKIFRSLQFVSASLYSLGHGGNDAQKTMGIIAEIGRASCRERV